MKKLARPVIANKGTETVYAVDCTPRAAAAPVRLIAPTLGIGASARARLDALLKIFSGDDRALIVISADPDAIASAVALKRILWRRVSQVSIASINQMKRADNLRLLAALNLRLEPFESLDLAGFSKLLMVDSQPCHSPLTRDLTFNAVIDHHPLEPLYQKEAPGFADVRLGFGATATMMAGYLRAAKIRPNQKLATALFYAIKADTQNFVRQGQADDMQAFQWLYPHIHHELLVDIERAPIAKSSFKYVLEGLNGAVFKKNAARSFLARVDHADTLVQAADLLMMIDSVNRAVVAGVCGDRVVVIFRGSGRRQDVGKLAARAFSQSGSAGGHKNMARAEIPLENLDPRARTSFAALTRFLQRRLTAAAAPEQRNAV